MEYAKSWLKNHKINLLSPKQLRNKIIRGEEFTHIISLLNPENDIMGEVLFSNANLLTLKFKDTNKRLYGPNEDDIDEILEFAGKAFIKDYHFNLAVVSEGLPDGRVTAAGLIIKYATVGEVGQGVKTYIDLLNPTKYFPNVRMVALAIKSSQDINLNDLCQKIWKDAWILKVNEDIEFENFKI